MHYSSQKQLPHTAAFLFDIIQNVEAYPQFLPWCQKITVLERAENKIVADMTLGKGPFTETFRSDVELTPHRKVIIRSHTAPLRHLESHWVLDENDNGTHVRFDIDFELNNTLLAGMLKLVLNQIGQTMVQAFEDRAAHLAQQNMANNA